MADRDTKRALESIGANVARLRLRTGMTQAALAEAADLDLRFVQRVERATTNLGVGALVALARSLHVDPRDLLVPANLPPAKRGRPSGATRRRR